MRQAMWHIALEPQVILPTSAYSIQHTTRRTAPSPLWGMLRFHSSLYCTPQARFRFRKPPSGTARIGKGKGAVNVCPTSAWPQSHEPRWLSGERKSKNPRTNVHFSLFLAKSCRLCVGFSFDSARHSNADTRLSGSTVQFVAQQNPPPLLKLQLCPSLHTEGQS